MNNIIYFWNNNIYVYNTFWSLSNLKQSLYSLSCIMYRGCNKFWSIEDKPVKWVCLGGWYQLLVQNNTYVVTELYLIAFINVLKIYTHYQILSLSSEYAISLQMQFSIQLIILFHNNLKTFCNFEQIMKTKILRALRIPVLFLLIDLNLKNW